MNYKITEKLIDLFWKGLKGYSSNIWFDSSSNEKEEILWQAIEELDEPIDRDEALDLFWQWADGLEEDSFIDFTLSIPEKLYHATYKQFLDSIKANGLGNTTNRMWTDSRPGVVYLAQEPWEAEDYAEQAEWLDDKEDADSYLNNIVVLEIDTSKLDTDNLMRDENILPGGIDTIGFEYHGIIPWSACNLLESELTESQTLKTLSSENIKVEEKNGRFEIYKNNKLVCTCDNMKEVKNELRDLEESADLTTEDLHSHSKGYNIIEFSDKVGWDSSARDWARVLINTLDDSSIRILDYYEDKNFCDFKVNQHGDIITYRVRPGGQITIRMHESNSVVDEFKLYENLWD